MFKGVNVGGEYYVPSSILYTILCGTAEDNLHMKTFIII